MCNKKFLTYEEQIEKLKNKGLTINDENKAIHYLKLLSYYSLISGYKKIFQDTCSKKYLKQIDFNDIVLFYFFDNELRLLFLKYIIIIEQNIKSTLSYEFCNEYGENQKEYLSQENYFITHKNKSEINKLINLLSDIINKNDYPFITYNKDKYNNIPLWILMHAVTFGQLSKMYSYQKNIIKIKVSQNFIDVLPKNLENYLNILTKFRNVAAHGERFYCFKTKTDIQDTTIHKKLKISQKNGKYTKGKNDLFSIIIIFYYLLTHEDFLTFCEQLEKILLLGEKALSHIKNKNLLELMGIPQNWIELKKMKKDTAI